MKSTRLRAALTIILAALLALVAVVWAPPAHAASSCTIVWLDGDGQYGARRPSSTYLIAGPDGIAAVAAEQGCDLWVPQPPGGQVTWWQRGRDNALWLHTRLPEGRLILGGYSGGAQLLTEWLLPTYTLPAGTRVLLVGGGDRPRTRVTAAGNHTLHWVTGAADRDGGDGWDTLDAAQRGHAWYTAAGWTTSAWWPAGVTHDDYSFGELLRGMLAESYGPTVRPSVAATPLPHRTTRPHHRYHHRWAARGPLACRPV